MAPEYLRYCGDRRRAGGNGSGEMFTSFVELVRSAPHPSRPGGSGIRGGTSPRTDADAQREICAADAATLRAEKPAPLRGFWERGKKELRPRCSTVDYCLMRSQLAPGGKAGNNGILRE